MNFSALSHAFLDLPGDVHGRRKQPDLVHRNPGLRNGFDDDSQPPISLGDALDAVLEGPDGV
eukprot:3679932-Pyramimonas_sp.AAC.1